MVGPRSGDEGGGARSVVLALSGGAVRAAGHVGAICALAEAGVPVAGVVGTSAGAFVGALFASGRYSTAELERVARDLKWHDVLRPAFSLRGLCASERVGASLRQLIGNVRFADLPYPFAAVACDLRTGERLIVSDGDVCLAVQASCSLPVFFTPTVIRDRLLVDGGAVSQLPVLAARERFPDRQIVGVDVNCRAAETARLGHMMAIGVQVVSLFARQNAARERLAADRMIDVDASGVALYDLSKVGLMIDRGRAATHALLSNDTMR
jgi:NTE family protein